MTDILVSRELLEEVGATLDDAHLTADGDTQLLIDAAISNLRAALDAKPAALIDGPGVGAVANSDFCPHCNPCRNSERIAKAERLNIEYDAVLRSVIGYLSAGAFSDMADTGLLLIDPKRAEDKLRWGIDHLPPSDSQGPFDKSRLKRLVTQVFGEGWQIVPKEPTSEMYAAVDNERLAQLYWRKLLSAAHQPPASKEKGE